MELVIAVAGFRCGHRGSRVLLMVLVLGAVVLALGVDLAALPPGAPAATVWALRPPAARSCSIATVTCRSGPLAA